MTCSQLQEGVFFKHAQASDDSMIDHSIGLLLNSQTVELMQGWLSIAVTSCLALHGRIW